MEDSLIQRLYEATDNGLNIILSYYPQAAGCDRPGKFFKIRPDEKTASASMKQPLEINEFLILLSGP